MKSAVKRLFTLDNPGIIQKVIFSFLFLLFFAATLYLLINSPA
jgi:hypothetical protein